MVQEYQSSRGVAQPLTWGVAALLSLAACGQAHRAGARVPTESETITVELSSVGGAPRQLCVEGSVAGETEPRLQASLERSGDWIVVTRIDRGENENGTTLRRYYSATHEPASPVDVGCGWLSLHSTSIGKDRRASAPLRVVADMPSGLHELGATPVPLVDFHEDSEGGSGGVLVTAEIAGNLLRLTERDVSRGAGSSEVHWTTTTEIELRGPMQMVVETKVAPIAIRAEPRTPSSGEPRPQ